MKNCFLKRFERSDVGSEYEKMRLDYHEYLKKRVNPLELFILGSKSSGKSTVISYICYLLTSQEQTRNVIKDERRNKVLLLTECDTDPRSIWNNISFSKNYRKEFMKQFKTNQVLLFCYPVEKLNETDVVTEFVKQIALKEDLKLVFIFTVYETENTKRNYDQIVQQLEKELPELTLHKNMFIISINQREEKQEFINTNNLIEMHLLLKSIFTSSTKDEKPFPLVLEIGVEELWEISKRQAENRSMERRYTSPKMSISSTSSSNTYSTKYPVPVITGGTLDDISAVNNGEEEVVDMASSSLSPRSEILRDQSQHYKLDSVLFNEKEKFSEMNKISKRTSEQQNRLDVAPTVNIAEGRLNVIDYNITESSSSEYLPKRSSFYAVSTNNMSNYKQDKNLRIGIKLSLDEYPNDLSHVTENATTPQQLINNPNIIVDLEKELSRSSVNLDSNNTLDDQRPPKVMKVFPEQQQQQRDLNSTDTSVANQQEFEKNLCLLPNNKLTIHDQDDHSIILENQSNNDSFVIKASPTILEKKVVEKKFPSTENLSDGNEYNHQEGAIRFLQQLLTDFIDLITSCLDFPWVNNLIDEIEHIFDDLKQKSLTEFLWIDLNNYCMNAGGDGINAILNSDFLMNGKKSFKLKVETSIQYISVVTARMTIKIHEFYIEMKTCYTSTNVENLKAFLKSKELLRLLPEFGKISKVESIYEACNSSIKEKILTGKVFTVRNLREQIINELKQFTRTDVILICSGSVILLWYLINKMLN